MLRLALGRALARILCLGAHSDDIEIGCGGTLLRLLADHPGTAVHWLVFSASEERAAEARASAAWFLEGAAERTVEIRDFRDGFFPYNGGALKEAFEGLKQTFSPDLILTHYRDDRHQDHRAVSDLTWNTFRDHLILEYEIPKWDGDFGSPNLFVPLDEATVKRKIEALLACFPSQRSKHWFDEETFRAVLRLRGMESGSRYAEAFYCRKLVL
jgi:LmbE family N-acetylglucosaminyl deacetylase